MSTRYTGDRLLGALLVSRLEVTDLTPGQIHRFVFEGVSNALGQPAAVPLLVARGRSDGPCLGLQACVHGDELSGLAVIQRLFADLSAGRMSGSIVAALGVNPSGMLAASRNWQLSTDGGSSRDFNRVWPGRADGDPAEQQAFRLMQNLWLPNITHMLDLHSQSLGTDYPLYLFADYRNPEVRGMAECFPADMIKEDEGAAGTAESALMNEGIAALTVEIGEPRRWQPDLIERTLTGVRNILIRLGMIDTPEGANAADYGAFVGNEVCSVRVRTGGFFELTVSLGADVEAGEVLAVQRNIFGDVLHRYRAPVAGRVLSTATDPMREAGSMLVRILYRS